MKAFSKKLDETNKLNHLQIILGLIASILILIGSTWGVLSLLDFAQVFIIDPSNLLRYTMYMFLGSMLAVIVALIICLTMTRYPRLVNLLLRIHRFIKKGTGEYFLSPEPSDQSWSNVIRRSLYGSILIVGISLTVLGFDMIFESGSAIIPSGTFLMIASIIVLPITVMEFYFGPWLIKDSGLFHLDTRDRSLSNVGDDLEDILEFFAGIDILFIIIELAFNVGPTDPWLPIFIVLIPLGPLFSLVLTFTIIFMVFQKSATESMMEFISTRYEVPDILSSPDYIRNRVLALVERDLISSAEELAESTDAFPVDENDEDGESSLVSENDSALGSE